MISNSLSHCQTNRPLRLAASESRDQAQGRQGGRHHPEPHVERTANILVQGGLGSESHEGDLRWTLEKRARPSMPRNRHRS